MSKDTWFQIVLGLLIIPPIGYLSVTVFTMNGTLSSVHTKVETISPRVDRSINDLSGIKGKLGSVETKLSFTNERVDKIAEALPGVSIRVAREQITRPIMTSVVSTTPHTAKDVVGKSRFT